jgi:hypothetical protein
LISINFRHDNEEKGGIERPNLSLVLVLILTIVLAFSPLSCRLQRATGLTLRSNPENYLGVSEGCFL